jgi:Domain of unknown function (DUF3841)
MRLWHITEGETLYKALLGTDKLVHTHKEHISDTWTTAYDWLREQMINRGYGPVDDDVYPFWAWAKRPDLRSSGHLPAGAMGYRITLDVPDEKILLSDFYNWHCVLNNYHVTHYLETEAEADALYDRYKKERSDELQRKLKEDREVSWQHIFDPTFSSSNSEQQATFFGMHISYVEKIERFISR